MKERLSSAQRIEFLFDQIRRGIVAEEAYAALDQFEVSFKKKKRLERGDKSEYNAMQAILSLPMVWSVKRSARLSPEDIMGIDLTVKLDDPIESVGVQVKSSDEDVRKFRDFGSQSGQYRTDGEEILAKRGLIVLNGRAPSEVIQENFLNGLEVVRELQNHLTEVA